MRDVSHRVVLSEARRRILPYQSPQSPAFEPQASGRKTIFTYDVSNLHLTSVQEPDGSTYTYSYDSGSNLPTRNALTLVTYPTEAIRISHFPVRDFAAFERKIVSGGAAYARNTTLDPSVGRSWRWLGCWYS